MTKQEKNNNIIPFFTWRKDKGFVINGYIKDDVNSKDSNRR